jgi:hypothetical protein
VLSSLHFCLALDTENVLIELCTETFSMGLQIYLASDTHISC